MTAGDPQFRLSAEPAPPEDLTVRVTIAFPDCGVAQASESVTISAGESHALLTVTTVVEVGAAGCEVIAMIAAGDGYEIGAAAGASASVTLSPVMTPVVPVVTVTADSETVIAGNPVSFTLTAAPMPATDLPVSVRWSQVGSFLTAGAPQTVTIPPSGTAPLKADTDNDEADERDGTVTVTVGADSGYTVGAQGSATVTVTDNDPTTRSPAPATPAPATPAPAIPGPATPGPTIPGPTPEDTTPTPAVTISAPGSTPHDILSHARVVSVDEGTATSFTLKAVPAPASELTVTLSWQFAGDLVSPPENTELVLTPRPDTVTIDTSGTASFTVTAGDDNKKNNYLINDLVSVWPGDGYERGDTHRLFFRIEDDD